MATIKLKYVQTFSDRHGKVRSYYRRPGFPRVVLLGEPGSPEFLAAYAKASGERQPTAHSAAEVMDRSISALIQRYYASSEFQSLKEVTKKNYRNILDRFRGVHGSKSAVTIQTKHLNAIFSDMEYPVAAFNLRKRLSRVFRLSVRLGWRSENPVTNSEAVKPRSEGFIPWTEEEISQFNRFWPDGSKPRLALALLVYTGVRRSDVVKLGWQHVKDGRISVVQKKGGKRMSVPLHPELLPYLTPLTGLTFILTEYGKPYSEAGFTSWFVDRAKRAGLHERTPHGLRKAAGRRLAEVGCSEKEIASWLGQDSVRQVDTYTRDANKVRLADNAGAKLLASGEERRAEKG